MEITLNLDPETVALLDQLAVIGETTREEIIRCAVEDYALNS